MSAAATATPSSETPAAETRRPSAGPPRRARRRAGRCCSSRCWPPARTRRSPTAPSTLDDEARCRPAWSSSRWPRWPPGARSRAPRRSPGRPSRCSAPSRPGRRSRWRGASRPTLTWQSDQPRGRLRARRRARAGRGHHARARRAHRARAAGARGRRRPVRAARQGRSRAWSTAPRCRRGCATPLGYWNALALVCAMALPAAIRVATDLAGAAARAARRPRPRCGCSS